MALFKSSVLTQASGSVGGLTYSHAKGGMYMRARAVPVNPGTIRQAQARNSVRDAVTRWNSTLTPAQREGWNQYAANVTTTNALGDTINLSGQQMYVRSRSVSCTLNQIFPDSTIATWSDVAPTIYDLGEFNAPVNNSATTSTGLAGTLIDSDLWAGEAGSFMIIYEGLPQNPGRNFFGGPWRIVQAVEGNATPPTTFDVSPTELINRGYTYGVGNKVWLACRVLRADGRLSGKTKFAELIATEEL